MPTTQRVSTDPLSPMSLPPPVPRRKALASRSRSPCPWALTPGAGHRGGAAVQPATVRTREAGAVGFWGRSSSPTGGPKTVTCHAQRHDRRHDQYTRGVRRKTRAAASTEDEVAEAQAQAELSVAPALLGMV